jgi:hypothetical protein
MNAMPSVIVEADNDAVSIELLFVVIAECKERKVSSVPGIVSVDVDYTQVWFADKDRLLFKV